MAALIDKLEHAGARSVCARHANRSDALLEILRETQEVEGYLSDDALRAIAAAINISRAEIHGVVSFYHDFHREAPARHSVKLCRAEACQAVGSEKLAAHAEQKWHTTTGGRSADNQLGLEAVYCLGNCALGPAAMIDGDLYGRVTPERLDALISQRIEKAERE